MSATANSGVHVERLAPLDLVMPNMYVPLLLLFRTTKPLSVISETLQGGLDRLCLQLPWLCGHVHPTDTMLSQGQLGLEIRWNADGNHRLVLDNKGSIPMGYDELAAARMPPSSIPDHIWPVSTTSLKSEDLPSDVGLPVLMASVFRFGDNQGVGLCVCMLHSVVDGMGLNHVLQLWTTNMRIRPAATLPCPVPVLVEERRHRLSRALATDIQAVSTLSVGDLLALHPEYRYLTSPSIPPTAPPPTTSPPACACKVFRVPLARIDLIKGRIAKGSSPSAEPTTNTVLSALLWSVVSRVREQRNPGLANETSCLITSVNGRRHFPSEPETLYFGNLLGGCLSRLSVGQLSMCASGDDGPALAAVCDAISQSISRALGGWRYYAEVHSLLDRVDYRDISPWWNWLASQDLNITSWANFGMYSFDFGPQLGGCPEFIRIRAMEADSNILILPRRRGSEEVLEVIIVLRKDDMDALEENSLWRWLST